MRYHVPDTNMPTARSKKAAHHIAQRFAPLPPSDIGGDVVDAAVPTRCAPQAAGCRAQAGTPAVLAKSRQCIRSALGVTSCPDLMPDLWRLVDDFDVASRNCLNAGFRRAGEVFVAENGRN